MADSPPWEKIRAIKVEASTGGGEGKTSKTTVVEGKTFHELSWRVKRDAKKKGIKRTGALYRPQELRPRQPDR